MDYKPKIVTGKITGTGWPIDGHVLHLSLWDYDRENWHLYGWDGEVEGLDEAVMLTIYQTETEAGLCLCDSLEDFTEKWKAKEWEPQGVFGIPLDKVEVLEVLQEENKLDTREKLIAHGVDLTPRRSTDKGGILLLPMEKSLNGDIKAKHPDWELIECPHCGRKCWKQPEADRLQKEQGVQLLCTKCGLEAGLISPYRAQYLGQPYRQTSGPNRAQRRRARRERRKR